MKYLPLLFISMLFSSCSSAETEPKTGLPLVFAEDFEKGRDNWTVTDEKSWKHQQEENGNHVFSVIRRKSHYKPKFRSPGHIALIKGLELEDFVLMYKVKGPFPERPAHRDSCAFFCYQNPNQFYYVHTGMKPDPYSGQVMLVNKAPRKAITKNKNKTPWKENVWHQVKVVRDSKSGLIEIYFDDMNNPYIKVKDTTFGRGQIGIGTFDDINHFDDIKVYGK